MVREGIGGGRGCTWMRAEREAGAGEERRWRGCLELILYVVDCMVGGEYRVGFVR